MKRAVHIAGGGLAGLALGVGLRRRDVPVVLHEANAYPRHRVCGEFIAGLRSGVLETLGIEASLADARHLTKSLWRLREKEVYRQEIPEPALGLSRYCLDARLAELFVELGGELRTGDRQQRQDGQKGWVWATGRERSASDWIGLKLHCQNMTLEAELEFHLGYDAYVGLSPVEDGRVNVCGLFRRREVTGDGRIDQLPTYLDAAGLGALAERVRAGDPDPVSAVGVTSLSYAPATWDGELRLGDQTGLIAPFTGNGMAQALEGAALALDPIHAYSEGRNDWAATVAKVNEDLRRAFSPRRSVARRLHPWLLDRHRQKLLAVLAQARMLPFGLLFRLTH